MNHKKDKNIDYYKYLLKKLRLKRIKGIPAPHKPILLLSICKLIEEGRIQANEIPLSSEIKDTFNLLWDIYIGYSGLYSKNPWTPFWHMKKEPFWHFEPINSKEEVDSLVPTGQTASIGKMRSAIKYAYLDQELYELFADEITRRIIVDIIKDEYIQL